MEGERLAPQYKAIDATTFWRAVGQRATGSTIVTARSAEGPAGFLGLSATHVCANPPLMLVAVDKRTSALSTILAAGHFAINYLPSNATATVDMFSGKTPQKGGERFRQDEWEFRTTGAPVFMNAIGTIDCTLEETIHRHGVCLAIGRVVDVYQGRATDPLIHFRGGYL